MDQVVTVPDNGSFLLRGVSPEVKASVCGKKRSEVIDEGLEVPKRELWALVPPKICLTTAGMENIEQK
jgi:hypothetical protein